jgi:hypothetical protein
MCAPWQSKVFQLPPTCGDRKPFSRHIRMVIKNHFPSPQVCQN